MTESKTLLLNNQLYTENVVLKKSNYYYYYYLFLSFPWVLMRMVLVEEQLSGRSFLLGYSRRARRGEKRGTCATCHAAHTSRWPSQPRYCSIRVIYWGPPDFDVQKHAVACIACHATWLACVACHAADLCAACSAWYIIVSCNISSRSRLSRVQKLVQSTVLLQAWPLYHFSHTQSRWNLNSLNGKYFTDVSYHMIPRKIFLEYHSVYWHLYIMVGPGADFKFPVRLGSCFSWRTLSPCCPSILLQ